MENSDFFTDLKVVNHQYLLCDVHVHSIASADILHRDKFSELSDKEKEIITSKVEKYDSFTDKWSEFDKSISDVVSVEEYFKFIEERRNQIADSYDLSRGGKDWAIIAITDHNTCRFSCKLSKYSWDIKRDKRIIILPGLELDIEFEVKEELGKARAHICLIYPPCTNENQIHTSINKALQSQGVEKNWNFGEILELDQLNTFVYSLRNNSSLPVICIAVHVSSSKGVREATLKVLSGAEAEYIRLFAEYEELTRQNDAFGQSHSGKQIKEKLESLQDIIGNDDFNISVLKLIGNCGFDALQVSNKEDDVHYRCLHRFKEDFGRAVTILCSDAHTISNIFDCGDGYIPYIKFPQFKSSIKPIVFFEYLRHYSLRFGETRFTSIPANTVACYIVTVR